MKARLHLFLIVVIILSLATGCLFPAAATDTDASLNTLLQSLYQLAGRYMREGKFEEAADLYYQLINYDYMDSYELFREANDTQNEAADIAVIADAEPTIAPTPTTDPNQTVSLMDAFSSAADTQDVTVYKKPDVVPWPRVTIPTYSLTVKDRGNDRIMGYAGPGKAYLDAGAYFTFQFTRTDGLFREGDYVFVDFNYKSVGMRRLYIESRHFKNVDSVPELNITGYPGITVTSVETYYGPGLSYNKISGGTLSSGAALTVFLEERNYVFAEFNVEDGVARGWIDARYVEPI